MNYLESLSFSRVPIHDPKSLTMNDANIDDALKGLNDQKNNLLSIYQDINNKTMVL